jgi:orotidine-5'-phosphate decarboxylase
MTRKDIFHSILKRRSFLCVGLDSDEGKIPDHLFSADDDPVYLFNKAIIEATADLCVAYKINLAFYEILGARGWEILKRTLALVSKSHFVIADAKRGDIGNTASMYARTFFNTYDFDAVTVAPYMGKDSVIPFCSFPEKWVILLALTSNAGSRDFQFVKDESGELLFERVLTRSQEWGSSDQIMYVVGATHPEQLKEIRKRVPDHFLLIPGVGAQGGDLTGVAKAAMNKEVGILVNSSRGIIYAGNELDFAEKARKAALILQEQMNMLLQKHFPHI